MEQGNDKHDDLFRQMADKLRTHNEPYRYGAWERFAVKYGIRRSPRGGLWSYGIAAALFAAVVSIALLVNRQVETPSESLVTTEVPTEASDVLGLPEDTSLRVEQKGDGVTIDVKEAFPDLRMSLSTHTTKSSATAAQEDSIDDVERKSINEVGAEGERLALVTATKPETENPIGEASGGVNTETRGNEQGDDPLMPLDRTQPVYAGANGTAIDERDKRWNLSLVLAPSMTSEKINMGGGLAVSYRISDKISVSSGVSLSEMGVGQYPGGARNGNLAAAVESPVSDMDGSSELNAGYTALGGTYLASTTSSLLAMDVPFDVRYHVSDRFYSSVGVSVVAILDERRTVHYSTTTLSQTLNGTQQHRHEFSQKATQQPIADQRFGGFVNFSIGHRMPLSKGVSLSLEPYFKLPMGRLSRQDMNLTHGGLKIVTGF